jgi:Rieske Fe-S protein
VAECEVCGNDYDKAFELTVGGETHTFDSFECAIHAVAPTCAHCGCKIIGHGIEDDGTMFCCAHCATSAGVTGVADRA